MEVRNIKNEKVVTPLGKNTFPHMISLFYPKIKLDVERGKKGGKYEVFVMQLIFSFLFRVKELIVFGRFKEKLRLRNLHSQKLLIIMYRIFKKKLCFFPNGFFFKCEK